MSVFSISNSYFSRTINSGRVARIIHDDNKAQATSMGLLDRFIDLFYDEHNKKATFLTRLHDFIHVAGEAGDNPDSAAIRQILNTAPVAEVHKFFLGEDEEGRTMLSQRTANDDADFIRAYTKFLALIPESADRDQIMNRLVFGEQEPGFFGFTAAISQASSATVDAYVDLLAALSEATRASRRFVNLVAARDPAGYSAVGYVLDTGNQQRITAYEKALALIPASRGAELRAIMITDPTINWSLSKAMCQEDTRGIEGYTRYMAMVPPEHRNEQFVSLLAGNNVYGTPALHCAARINRHGAFASYHALLQLLPDDDNGETLAMLLTARSPSGQPALGAAMEYNHPATVRAMRPLLAMLSDEQRNYYLSDILHAENQEQESGLLRAMHHGFTDTTTAFMELLTLLPAASRDSCVGSLLTSSGPFLSSVLSCGLASPSPLVAGQFTAIAAMLSDEARRSIIPSSLASMRFDTPASLLSSWLRQRDTNLLARFCNLAELVPAGTIDETFDQLINAHGVDQLESALMAAQAEQMPIYERILALLSPEKRDRYLAQILQKADLAQQFNQLVPAHERSASIDRYKALLRMMSPAARDQCLATLLKGRPGAETPIVALAFFGGTASVMLFRELVDMLSPAGRKAHLTSILAATGKSSAPILGTILKSGAHGWISVFGDMAQLVPEDARDENFVNMLAAKDSRGNTGLAWAMDMGKDEAVAAYRQLLELIPPARRSAALRNILSAVDQRGDTPLLLALTKRNFKSVAAFQSLLTLIPRDEHTLLAYAEIFLTDLLRWPADALLTRQQNGTFTGLLQCIDDISDEDLNIRTFLLVMVGSATANPAHQTFILNSLSKDPHCVDNAGVWQYLVNQGNKGKLLTNPALTAASIAKFQAMEAPGKFMLDNNGFFVQLIAQAIDHTDPTTRESAKALYDRYLALPELARHRVAIQEVTLGEFQGVRGTGAEGEALAPIGEDDPAYLFVQRDTDKSCYNGLLLSNKQMRTILDEREGIDWTHFIYLIASGSGSEQAVNVATTGQFDPRTVMPKYPVFADAVRRNAERHVLTNYFRMLDLRCINPQKTTAFPDDQRDYTDAFRHATATKKSTARFVSGADEEAFTAMFGRYLKNPDGPLTPTSLPELTDQHAAALDQLIADAGFGSSAAARANALYCLATVMVGLSSEDHFGTNYDSPRALRTYAGALLNRARELDPTVCSGTQLNEFMDRLFGFSGILTCTAILYNMLRSHANDQPALQQVMVKIKPEFWK